VSADAAAAGRNGQSRLAGTLLALVSATGFGTLPVLFALATRTGFERHSLLAQRFLLAGLLLLAWLAARGRARPAWRPLLACVVLGFLGYASQAWMYFTAVALSGAGLATVLLYLYPSFVTLIAWALHGERPDRARLGALALALVGSLLTCSFGPLRPSLLGVAASVAAALLYALYLTLSGVVLREVRALSAGAWVCLGAGAAFTLLAAAGGRATPADTPQRAAFVVALALLCTIVPIVALFAAIARIGVARSAVISTVEPAVTLGLARLLLGERFSVAQLAGALLVVASVLLIQREAS
jgi:drug/metabolite transporter (DMT)-like permease